MQVEPQLLAVKLAAGTHKLAVVVGVVLVGVVLVELVLVGP